TDKILQLKPDLVIGFSDLQADIARELAKAGLNVMLFNQRSVEEILNMIQVLSSVVGVGDKGVQLVKRFEAGLAEIRESAKQFVKKPKVYFEEWDDPMISGIRWVSELIGIAGGDDCFPELAREPLGKNRIIADAAEVVRRRPDIIIGSWCGKKYRPERVRARAGWSEIPAVATGQLHEVKS